VPRSAPKTRRKIIPLFPGGFIFRPRAPGEGVGLLRLWRPKRDPTKKACRGGTAVGQRDEMRMNELAGAVVMRRARNTPGGFLLGRCKLSTRAGFWMDIGCAGVIRFLSRQYPNRGESMRRRARPHPGEAFGWPQTARPRVVGLRRRARTSSAGHVFADWSQPSPTLPGPRGCGVGSEGARLLEGGLCGAGGPQNGFWSRLFREPSEGVGGGRAGHRSPPRFWGR